jgi:signal transduction histidine kinase
MTRVGRLVRIKPSCSSESWPTNVTCRSSENCLTDVATGVRALRTSAADGMVEVAITDNGCGIAPENAHQVFDPFFTTKGVGRGTGQGLSISHAAVVTRHGGTLSFDTEVGRGTTFFVRVPVDGISEPSAECPGAAA